MKKLHLICLSALFIMPSVSPAQKTKIRTANLPEKIFEVKSIEFVVGKKNPDELTVVARGVTNSADWANGSLKPTFSVKKSKDGIYQFDFMATPPAEKANVAVSVHPITAEYVFKSIPENLKSVIVYSENNNIEKKYGEASLESALYTTCKESKPGTIVFTKGGDYKFILQRLDMGKREDASICIEGTKKCWEHLQYFSVGSAITFNNITKGSELVLNANEKKSKSPSGMRMNDSSCPPREGFVYFEDANGFKMKLMIVPVELVSEIVE